MGPREEFDLFIGEIAALVDAEREDPDLIIEGASFLVGIGREDTDLATGEMTILVDAEREATDLTIGEASSLAATGRVHADLEERRRIGTI